jgi:deoxyribodipyrimidine photo-lyase
LRRDPDLPHTTGPAEPVLQGDPEAVWLTAESLGTRDPAIEAHPEIPAIFVFDLPLLTRLRLSAGRLIFLAECLADLAKKRELHILIGEPVQMLTGIKLAATFTPVPGWRAKKPRLEVVAEYPWPWLIKPHAGSVTSFTAWARSRP